MFINKKSFDKSSLNFFALDLKKLKFWTNQPKQTKHEGKNETLFNNKNYNSQNPEFLFYTCNFEKLIKAKKNKIIALTVPKMCLIEYRR